MPLLTRRTMVLAMSIRGMATSQRAVAGWITAAVALREVDHGDGDGAAEEGAAGIAHKDFVFRKGFDGEVKQ